MNVLMMTTIDKTSGGGVGNAVISSAKALKDLNVQGLITCLEKGLFSKAVEDVCIPVLTPKTFNFELFGRHVFTFFSVTEIKKIVKEYRIDIIHAHNNEAGFSGLLAAKWCRIPFIMTVHGAYPFLGVPFAAKKYAVLDFIVNGIIGFLADKIIAVSHFVKNKLVARGISSAAIEVIPNGFNTSRNIIVYPERVRKEFIITEKDFVIGTVARLDMYKGYPYLIKAAKIIAEQIPAAKFICVGNKNTEYPFAGELKKNNLQDRFIFTGYRSDVFSFLSVMDVFVLASISEGCGIVLFEAMFMKKPIVAAKTGGIPEIVGETEALLVPPANEQKIAEAVIAFYRNPELRRRTADRGYERLRHFDISLVALKQKALYMSL